MKLKMEYQHIKVLYVSGNKEDVIAHRGVLENNVCSVQQLFSSNDLTLQIQESLYQAKHDTV